MRLGYGFNLSERTKELLDDGVLLRIISQVQADINEEWKGSAPHDAATREQLFHEHHALTRIRNRIDAIVADLKWAEES